MTKYGIAIYLIATFTTIPAAIAQVNGFVETFSGEGEFDIDNILGFEIPDWSFTRRTGGLLEGVFTIDNSGFDIAPSELSRMVADRGSFTQRIEIGNLELSNFLGLGSASLSFTHTFNVDSPSDRVEFVLTREEGSVEQHRLDVRVFNTDFSVLVDRPIDIALQMEFDAVRSTARLSYDDLGDDADPLILGGAFLERQGSFGDQQTSVAMEAHGFTFARGEIDSWSLLFAERGDFDGDGVYSIVDLEALREQISSGNLQTSFDLNDDRKVDFLDLKIWVKEIKQTWIGDSNFDGEFNSADFIAVFGSGEFEDDIAGNSTWTEGDWNGDGDFDTFDFVVAFVDAGYEVGPRSETIVVPEPCLGVLLGYAVVGALIFRRRTASRLL